MAHPRLTRRIDGRVLLAAGAAGALLATPALATSAEGATALLDGQQTDASCAVDLLGEGVCGDAGLLTPATSVLPEPLQRATDPVENVIDGVLQSVPEPVRALVDELPGPVGDVVESVAGGDADGVVESAVESVISGVVEDVVGGTPLPTAVGELLGNALPAPIAPAPDVGTASSPLTPLPSSGPPQGPGTVTPPFATRGVPADTTVTRPPLPFVPPTVSAPLFGNLPRIAEGFLSRAPAASSDALSALRGAATTTAPGPDAPSWLLATAAGMLLLLGAGHLVHARQRYTASVAR